MIIIPYVSIDDLSFGESREEIHHRLGDPPHVFQQVGGHSEIDDYEALGFHLHYDADERLEFVETFPPANPIFSGVSLLGELASDVEQELVSLGHPCNHPDAASTQCDSAGISLYAPDGIVLSAAAFRRGYYDPPQ